MRTGTSTFDDEGAIYVLEFQREGLLSDDPTGACCASRRGPPNPRSWPRRA